MEEEGFKLPTNILNQLNEFSYGGFLLFSFDDKGTPRFYGQFDNELNMMALQKSAEYWLQGVHEISANNIKEHLNTASQENEDEEVDPYEDNWFDQGDDDDGNFSS